MILTVNDELVVLKSGSVISFTLQRVDVGQLTTRYISRTNSFIAPFNETNDIIFGNSKHSKSFSEKPYRKFPVKIIYKGIEVLSDGRAFISVGKDGYLITCYPSDIDFFDLIDGPLVNELQLISNSGWNESDIDSARNNSSGIVSAVIDWGRFIANDMDVSPFFLPCFFYGEIIKAIITDTGFSYSGEIFDSDDLNKLVIPFWSDWLYGDAFVFSRGVRAQNSTPQVLVYPTIPAEDEDVNVTVSVPVIISGNGIGWYDDGDSKYKVSNSEYSGEFLRVKLIAFFDITIINANAGDSTLVSFYSSRNGALVGTPGPNSSVIIGNTSTVRLSFSIEEDIQDGDDLYLNVNYYRESTMSIAQITIESVSTEYEVQKEINRNFVFWNEALPDISQLEIFTDFTVRFGLIYKVIDNVLHAKTIEQIINDKHLSVDWTNKRVESNEVIKFKSTLYQKNIFTYEDLISSTIGNGELLVDDENLPLQNEFYNSPFGNSQDVTINGVRMAYIPIFTDTMTDIGDYEDAPGLRLLTIRDSDSLDPDVIFYSTPRSDYKVASFTDETVWQKFIDRYYNSFRESVQKFKQVDRFYLLNEHDIKNYDPFVPMFDDGECFLINKIHNFIPGKITKVELFKVL